MNKKVILHECKRHTARHVERTCSAFPAWVWTDKKTENSTFHILWMWAVINSTSLPNPSLAQVEVDSYMRALSLVGYLQSHHQPLSAIPEEMLGW